MKKNLIDKKIIKDYVEAMNTTRQPMNEIKNEIARNLSSGLIEFKNVLEEVSKNVKSNELAKTLIPIAKMMREVDNQVKENIYKQKDVYTNIIKQIMVENNGMLSTRFIEPLNISRQYLKIMQNDNEIINISRGIYTFPNVFEDSYYSFQQKYKKAIFSHMNALYFYEMTEEFPSNYTITVPLKYHVEKMSEKHAVFYVSEKIYELGMIDVKTPSRNIVKAYDKERCICDIIRSKNRMDPEQVEKAVKLYINSKDKDMKKLYNYSEIMGIKDKVQEMVGGVY